MESYRFAEKAAAPGAPLVFLFHGTGGSAQQLLGLGADLWPEAHLIAPEGDVSEGGAARFFRRLGEGVFDMADLERATRKMSAFVREKSTADKPAWVGALGYSNGANILASLLFERPELVDRAVMMHPLIPFDPKPQAGLKGKAVLVTAGRRDPISPAAGSQKLKDYFGAQGAKAELVWHEGGHELRREELLAAQAFLKG